MTPRPFRLLPMLGLALFAMVATAARAFADPTADSQNLVTAFKTPLAITLTGSDPGGSPLTYFIVANPVQGTLSGIPPNVVYTPVPGFRGLDSFTFQASNGIANSNVATISITVTPPGPGGDPVAVDQSVTTGVDTPLAITLTGTDPDNRPLTYSIVGGPAQGTLSGAAPNVTYTPAAGYVGPDSFTFKVNNGFADSNIATVSVTVQPGAPTANSQSQEVAINTATPITLTGSDPGGLPLTYGLVSNPAHGTLTGSGADQTYTPAQDYTGPDSFTFNVSNGAVASGPATVTLNVMPLLPPILDVPETITTNDSISVTPAPGSFPAESYEWSFFPVSSGEGGGTGTGITKTSDAGEPLPSSGLAPGNYEVRVHGVAGQQVSKDSVARITVLPGNVSAVRVFPNPWRADRDADVNVTFDHVAPGTTIKIFDIAGHWVRTLTVAENSVAWDRRNDQGNEVASGLYLCLVTDPQGQKARKKLTIIK